MNRKSLTALSPFQYLPILTEASQNQLLADLHQVAQPVGNLFPTVYGDQPTQRAVNEPPIGEMFDVDDDQSARARSKFEAGLHAFILQHGHLTTTHDRAGNAIDEAFEYGVAFAPKVYVKQHWSSWFNVVDYRAGAIQDFQDIVVLTPKK